MHQHKAQLLLQHGRYDLALELLDRALAEDPDDGMTHTLRGLALHHLKKPGQAEEAMRQGLSKAGHLPLPHFLYAHLLMERNRVEEAVRAADEALRLAPQDADHYALRAQIEAHRRRWADVLDWARKGLAVDAEHTDCQNLRSLALTKLRRRDEADESIRETLRQSPQDPMAHANQGWRLLHQNQTREALEHFREALRLDPEHDWAKAGLVEALKALNPIYRVMLAFFLWVSTMSPRTRFGVLIGGYVLYQILLEMGGRFTAIKPFTLPIVVIYAVFAIMTWVAVPLFNLVLLTNQYGRAALTRHQRIGSILFGLSLLVPFGLFVVGLGLAIGTDADELARKIASYCLPAALVILPFSAMVMSLGTPRQRLYITVISVVVGTLMLAFTLDIAGLNEAALQARRAHNVVFIGSVLLLVFSGIRGRG